MHRILAGRFTLLLALLLALVAHPQTGLAARNDEQPIPALRSRVTDLTGTLSADQARALEDKLAQWEAKRGAQMAVLIVPTTAPEAIEQYSIRVAEAWKIGRKGSDDGIIIVLAKNDRAVRIEVGRGLEGAVPDVSAKRIIAEVMIPLFRNGDYFGGLQAGIDRIIGLTQGESLPPPRAPATQREQGNDPGGLFMIAMVMLFVIGPLLRRMFGTFLGSTLGGGVIGLLVWLIIGSMLIALVAGFIAVIFIAVAGRSGPTRTYGPGPWGGGWGSGRGGGFGGGSSGGWSGGGGTFGGGGASGRW